MTDTRKIVVVDDEIILLLDLTDRLTDAGYRAMPVTTARGALSLLDGSVEALVTDIELPGNYSGLQLARLAARLHPELSIIVVSGGVVPSAADLPPGALFFPKPYRIEALIAALAQQRRARAA